VTLGGRPRSSLFPIAFDLGDLGQIFRAPRDAHISSAWAAPHGRGRRGNFSLDPRRAAAFAPSRVGGIQVLLGTPSSITRRSTPRSRHGQCGPSPVRSTRSAALIQGEGAKRRLTSCARLAGGRRYLPGSGGQLPGCPCRSLNLDHLKGDVGDRELPYRRTRRACRRLRRLRPCPASLTTAAATGTAQSARGTAAREWLAAREADLLPVGYFHVVFTLPAQVSDIAWQKQGAGLLTCCSGLPRRQ